MNHEQPLTINQNMKYLTNFCRIFVGLLFIFSGLVKQNDPLGFSYKLEEYFEVFHLAFLNSFALALAIFLCALEIIMGIALLFGVKIKQTAWGLLLLIVFFSFLTFYSAYFDVVKTCGCFGDAIPLTPWQSFTKDLILLLMIMIIFFNTDKIKALFSEKGSWITLALAILFSFGFGIYTYQNLPFVDFLPYKIGNNLPSLMKAPEGAPADEYKIIYTLKNKKTGELKELDDKQYIASKIYENPDWEYVKASDPILVKEGYKVPIRDLKINDEDGNDATSVVLEDPQYSFWIIEYDLDNANKGVQEKLNQLTLMTEKYHARTLALTSATPLNADNFRHENNLYYEFFYADAVPLKSMVRANPGVLLMKNGTVINKWHFRNLPSIEELETMCFKK
ncbi:BT_3928 family protein [Solitalea lacus]|uniref:BT_3928 family protein n=1 Tax=Solitalea lacus TaxID=2911172 RepID=UPI001EDA5115|nr:BT_3928 family protein [Solitalea lacus]UKJ08374.1 DoxX family protein [Solitalea lacus]